jgi:hypothetical protein
MRILRGIFKLFAEFIALVELGTRMLHLQLRLLSNIEISSCRFRMISLKRGAAFHAETLHLRTETR